MDGYKDMRPVPLAKRYRKELLEVNLHTNVLQNFLIVPKGFSVIGTIRRGINMERLARDPEGQFLRVNGSYFAALGETSTRTVVNYLRAIERLASLARQKFASAPPDFASYLRKSRHIQLPGGDSPTQYEGMHLPQRPPVSLTRGPGISPTATFLKKVLL